MIQVWYSRKTTPTVFGIIQIQVVKKIAYVTMGNPQPSDLGIGQWFNDQRTHQRVHPKWDGNRGHLKFTSAIYLVDIGTIGYKNERKMGRPGLYSRDI